jgi:hypothetical protein
VEEYIRKGHKCHKEAEGRFLKEEEKREGARECGKESERNPGTLPFNFVRA